MCAMRSCQCRVASMRGERLPRHPVRAPPFEGPPAWHVSIRAAAPRVGERIVGGRETAAWPEVDAGPALGLVEGGEAGGWEGEGERVCMTGRRRIIVYLVHHTLLMTDHMCKAVARTRCRLPSEVPWPASPRRAEGLLAVCDSSVIHLE